MASDLRLSRIPEVRVQMGIHRPPVDVFAAFVDPERTERFWIVDSTGPLQPGATVTWDFNAEGAQATVVVRRYEPGRRLTFDWGASGDLASVDVRFSPWRDGGCFVEVAESGFTGDADELAARAVDSTGGFTMVLCSLKALLEHDIELRAVTDCAPD